MRARTLLVAKRAFSSSLTPPPAITTSPLDGVKILDMTRVLAGPFATMILSDLGAEVIKVERPGGGDDTRSWGPPFIEGNEGRQSAYFLSVNRNKQSICVDMKSKKGNQILQQLAAKSDVLVENYVPGKLASLGLGYETLSSLNPGLIYCSITGFGESGPDSRRGGYDVVAASMGGLLHVTGDPDGPPTKVGVAMTDLATALYAHGAILAALLQRRDTGKGQWIQCNLLATQVSCMTHLASNWLNCSVESSRWGSAHMSIVPYQTFPTSDGFLTIGCGNNNQFTELCKRMGEADLASEDKYASNERRVENRVELIGKLSKMLSSKTNSQWCEAFKGVSFPYGPVNKMSEVFEEPQVQHLGLQQKIAHPGLGQEVSLVGPAVNFSGSENRVRGPPPALGQHTDQVLRDQLGMEDEEIAELRRAGVVA